MLRLLLRVKIPFFPPIWQDGNGTGPRGEAYQLRARAWSLSVSPINCPMVHPLSLVAEFTAWGAHQAARHHKNNMHPWAGDCVSQTWLHCLAGS